MPTSIVVTVAASSDRTRVSALATDLDRQGVPLLVVALDRSVVEPGALGPATVLDGRARRFADVPLTRLAAVLHDRDALDDALIPLALSCALEHAERALYVDPSVAVVGDVAPLLAVPSDAARSRRVSVAVRRAAAAPDDGLRPDAIDLTTTPHLLAGAVGASRPAAATIEAWAALVVDAAARGERVTRRDALASLLGDGRAEPLDGSVAVADLWTLAVATEVIDAIGAPVLVDGRAIALLDTAGHDAAFPHRLLRHGPQPARRSLVDLSTLAAAIERTAADASAPSPFTNLPSGRSFDRVLRALHASSWRSARAADRDAPPDPFLDEAAFLEWAKGSDFPSPVAVPRYLRHVLFMRPDVAQAHPAVPGPSTDGLLEWAEVYGERELGMARDLFPVHTPAAPRAATPHPGHISGVNLAGFLDAELGLGEVARRVADALGTTKLAVNPVGVDRDGTVTGVPDAAHPIDIVCVNPDSLASFARAAGTRHTTRRYTIGIWFWETETLPDAHRWAFELVDEVWAASEFVAHSLRGSPVPVRRFPLPIVAPTVDPKADRAALGLPSDAFVAVVSFDHRSVLGRKNPIGAIEAYRRAFAPGDGAVLVVKSINGHRFPDDAAAVRWAARGRDDIVVRDEAMPASRHAALIAAADCLVSLHRSEGFGFNLADALALGVPTVATGWSGNTAFMGDGDGLVPFELVPIGPGHEPYPPEHRWAEPDLDAAAAALRAIADDPAAARAVATDTGTRLREQFAPRVCGDVIVDLLTTPVEVAPVSGRRRRLSRAPLRPPR